MDNDAITGQHRTKQEYGLSHAPSLLLALIALTVFIAEMTVMFIISLFPALPPVLFFTLDSTLLLLFIFPSLYFFVLRPIKLHIGQRSEAEARLSSSLDELRNLSNHLQTLREEERTRIAAEIHDELGQSLTALKMELYEFGKIVPPPLRDRCNAFCTRVDEQIRTVKRISTELRPSILDNYGLAAAIEWQAENFGRWAGVDCAAVIDFDEGKLSDSSSTALFRIVQESLTNIARHSGARYARVTIREKDGDVVLKVLDDGNGIPRHKIFAPESLGLIGIRERVKSLGGKIRIRGIPGLGTGVCITIPISESGSQE